VQEIACLERKEHRLEDVGLTLREAKKLLGAIQQRMVERQVEEYLETQRSCPHCGRARGLKGSHTVTFQTLFVTSSFVAHGGIIAGAGQTQPRPSVHYSNCWTGMCRPNDCIWKPSGLR
jgi:hypothetical protein